MHLPPELTHLLPTDLIRFLLGILLPLIVIGLIAEDVLAGALTGLACVLGLIRTPMRRC